MLKQIFLMSLWITSLAITPNALAADTNSGDPSSKTTVDLSFDSSQIASMLNGMSQTKITEADQSFIDELLNNPGDRVALTSAQTIIEKRLQWAMFELGELKKTALRYMIVGNNVENAKYLKTIAKLHTQKAQAHYNRALWALSGAYRDLPGVLRLCATELCVIKITDTFKELQNFVESVNEDVDFQNARSEVELFWNFKDPILKTSLSKTFHKLVPNNEDHNAWKVAGAALLAPLCFAGQVIVSTGEAAGTAIFNPRYLNIRFEIDEVDIDYDLVDEKLQNAADGALEHVFSAKLSKEIKSSFDQVRGASFYCSLSDDDLYLAATTEKIGNCRISLGSSPYNSQYYIKGFSEELEDSPPYSDELDVIIKRLRKYIQKGLCF